MCVCVGVLSSLGLPFPSGTTGEQYSGFDGCCPVFTSRSVAAPFIPPGVPTVSVVRFCLWFGLLWTADFLFPRHFADTILHSLVEHTHIHSHTRTPDAVAVCGAERSARSIEPHEVLINHIDREVKICVTSAALRTLRTRWSTLLLTVRCNAIGFSSSSVRKFIRR